MKKTLLSLTVAVSLGLSAASTFALPTYPVFTVNESVVAGAVANSFDADRVTGFYSEVTGGDGLGNFYSSAVGVFGDYLLNAAPADSQLQANWSQINPNNYRLYVKFLATGTVSGYDFTGTGGSAQIWLDAGADTKFDTAGTGTFNDPLVYATPNSNPTADILIGESFVSYGTGRVGSAPAGFEIFFDEFALTPYGKTYWVDPDPFYLRLRATGGTSGFEDQVFPFISTGDFSLTAAVPEPASLALVGLGLLGVGLSRRRKG